MVCSSGATLCKWWRAALQHRLAEAPASLLCSPQGLKSSWSRLEYPPCGGEAAHSVNPILLAPVQKHQGCAAWTPYDSQHLEVRDQAAKPRARFGSPASMHFGPLAQAHCPAKAIAFCQTTAPKPLANGKRVCNVCGVWRTLGMHLCLELPPAGQ